MNNKTVGYVLLILGVLLVVFDFLIEPLHLGGGGFGWKQILLLVVGIVAIGAGFLLGFTRAFRK